MQTPALVVQLTLICSLESTKYQGLCKKSEAQKDTEFSELINLFTLSSTMYVQTIAITVMLKGLLPVCLFPNLFPYSVRLYSLAFIYLFIQF